MSEGLTRSTDEFQLSLSSLALYGPRKIDWVGCSRTSAFPAIPCFSENAAKSPQSFRWPADNRDMSPQAAVPSPVKPALQEKPTPLITLISELCRQVLANKASLPSMPDVAARIHSAMASPNWSVSTIAAIIKGDPGTTTYLLQMANSAMYAGVTRIRDVEMAITRIGIHSTRSLVMGHALRSMYVTRSPILGALMRQTWQTSARLAALSAVLARKLSRLSPERALLAGLLQDIGVLPILNVLKEYQDQLDNEAQVAGAVERYTPQVGMVLLKHWGFEPDMVEVARSRGDWNRDPQPTADLADLVLLARLHDEIVQGRIEGLPRIDQVPAFTKFALGGLCPDSSLEFLHEEAESVKDVMRALGVEQ
jgi:HD-like signal output (HDOD) protein